MKAELKAAICGTDTGNEKQLFAELAGMTDKELEELLYEVFQK